MNQTMKNVSAPSSLLGYGEHSWREVAILQIIREIRGVFVCCFENSVSAVIVNELPTDFKTMRYIRNLISIISIDNQTIAVIETGVSELEQLLKIVNNYFLPRAKELMGISNLKPSRRVFNRDLFILRRLALTVLPANLQQLSNLVRELKNILALIG